MFGSYAEKFSAYKALLAYYISLPGKKLLFMGGEIGQFTEWKFDGEIEWDLLSYDTHRELNQFVRELNHFYLENKPFWEIDQSWEGYQWVNDKDGENSVLSYLRQGRRKSDYIIVCVNFTPVKREKYQLGVPSAGEYEIIMNTDWKKYGGQCRRISRTLKAEKKSVLEMPYSIKIDLQGLSAVYLRKKKKERKAQK